MHDPSSLLAKVLKGPYFKNSDIMSADIGNNPSFLWRLLLWGRDLLAKGLCWKVGDDCNIYAFSDSWILSLPNFKCFPKPRESQMMNVSNFIHHVGCWN